MEVGQNGKNLNSTLRKIIQLTRAFLRKPRVIILDEDALIMPEFDPKFFIESLFKTMNNSAIVSIIKNYRQLYHYTTAYILKDGEIVEEGNPLHLVDNKNSHLYKILVRDDIRTVKQLEMKLEKNVRKFEEDQESAVKYIQELMKQQLENEMNDGSKTDKEKEELQRIVRAISPRNIQNMVEKQETRNEKPKKNKQFTLRMKSMQGEKEIKDSMKKNNTVKFPTRTETSKTFNYKDQTTFASKGGIDLFITPASIKSDSEDSYDKFGYRKEREDEEIEIIFNGKKVNENFLTKKKNTADEKETRNDQDSQICSVDEQENGEMIYRKLTQ